MSGFDDSVVVDGHVQWWLLTTAEQADLLANYPMNPPATIPPNVADVESPDDAVADDAVDPRFEQWLDGAYLARHSTDNFVTSTDPTDW